MATKRRRRGDRAQRTRKRASQSDIHFKLITVDEACKIGHFSRPHFYRIRKHLDTRHLGRRIFVNEPSIYAYLRSLPK